MAGPLGAIGERGNGTPCPDSRLFELFSESSQYLQGGRARNHANTRTGEFGNRDNGDDRVLPGTPKTSGEIASRPRRLGKRASVQSSILRQPLVVSHH